MTTNNGSSSTKLWLPTLKREIQRPWFLPDKQTLEEQRKILSSIFFLVKQGDVFGERLRCTRCNNRHNYITLMCVERPITGLYQGLYLYYRAIKDHQLERELNPAQRARYDGIVTALGKIPNLGSMHPQTARQIMAKMGPSDMEVGALSLGVLEGIAPRHAAQLVQRINDRGLKPKLVLEMPNGIEVHRTSRYVRT